MRIRCTIVACCALLLATGCHTRVVNMIPMTLSGETNQDSEPFLSVNPTDHRNMVGSAFTPNPAGWGSPTAPVFRSYDGGMVWFLENIVPSKAITYDITHATDAGNADLYAAILRSEGYLQCDELETPPPWWLMSLQNTRSGMDQPFVQATSHGGTDRIYVGMNDLSLASATAVVDVSPDGGGTYRHVKLEPRSTGNAGQDAPSIRPAVATDGTVYVAYFGWRSRAGNMFTSDIVVARDDHGGVGTTPFRDLLDPGDGLAGCRVATGRQIPWVNGSGLGQERIGSTLSIAVDPTNSSIVYVAWADRVGTGDIYSIHVRRSTNRGLNWSGDLRVIPDATNAALAIADNGTVGLLYQQLTGGRYVTHLIQSRNGFSSVVDRVLATTPADQPLRQFLPYLGDYAYLLALEGKFHGIFSANNTPNRGNFPQGVVYQRRANFATHALQDAAGSPVAVSIDPFYFQSDVIR